MAQTSYGEPLFVTNETVRQLRRVPLGSAGSHYNEDYVRNLAFDYPACLPIAEIDSAYRDAVPICKELHTPAGPLDTLFVTPEGRLVVLEAKLWRNPEARRKVVAQILDYAKELSRWSYEDLQRSVSSATGRKGNSLMEIVREQHADLNEAEFVDAVSRGLKQGRFLLLIVGDGIREGVASIADFIQRVGSLEFTFGLVELAFYGSEEAGIFVQPRVLAHTEIIQRQVVVMKDGGFTLEEDLADQEEEVEISDAAGWYLEFWKELLNKLELDDPEQPLANTTKKGNIFFAMPPSMSKSWVSAFFVQGESRVGVYLTFSSGSLADRLWEGLLAEQEEIDKEIGLPLVWNINRQGKYGITTSKVYDDLRDPKHRGDIQTFVRDAINRFVNTFRPRLSRLTEE
ncbi:DUF4268 domain-containing protein [Roseibacillus persicicus]|nr:DUF4268 domain-containing protein [Roseibacillus persicicus]